MAQDSSAEGSAVSGIVWRFGDFELDPNSGELCKYGHNIHITPQASTALLCLVERPGRLVTREELYQRLWPDGIHVEFESNLNTLIRDIRGLLNDSARSPRFIQTEHRRGYRFLAEVTRVGGAPLDTELSQPVTPSAPVSAARYWWSLAVMMLIVVVGVVLWQGRRHQSAPMAGVPLLDYLGRMEHPAFSPDGTRLAFQWDGDGSEGFGIYVKRLDSGNMLRLTRSPSDDKNAAWSPDNRTLAFVRKLSNTQAALMLVPSAGGAERRIALIPDGSTLSWSADGHWIVYGLGTPEAAIRTGIWAVPLAGGPARNLTDPGPELLGDAYPAISPNGRWLAFFRCYSTGVNELHLAELTPRHACLGPSAPTYLRLTVR